MKKEIILILDNIRSVHNVGSIFRTADAAGISNVLLCGTTATPVDRFGRDRKDMSKVALGAEKYIPWEYFKTTKEAIQESKKDDFQIVAVEQSKSSVPYNEFQTQNKTALLLGTEVEGLSTDLLSLCDSVVEIPMRGKKESLNVSVAAGIVMYELIKK